MSNVLSVIRLMADDGEEWVVPLETVRAKITEALKSLSGTKEFVEIENVQIVAKQLDFVKITFELKTSLLCAETHVEKVAL
jgi:hypothetical protein